MGAPTLESYSTGGLTVKLDATIGKLSLEHSKLDDFREHIKAMIGRDIGLFLMEKGLIIVTETEDAKFLRFHARLELP